MELKELKSEVENLQSFSDNLHSLRKEWLDPLHKASRARRPLQEGAFAEFVANLDAKEKEQLQVLLKHCSVRLENLEQGTQNLQQIRTVLSKLTKVKLLSFQAAQTSDKAPFAMHSQLLAHLESDQFGSINHVAQQVQEFHSQFSELKELYEDVNGFLHQRLSLEQSIAFLSIPHYKYLKNLELVSHKKQEIISHVGRHYRNLSQEAKARKRR